MPFIDVTIAQGRSPDEVRALMRELTAAAHRAIGAPIANIRVCVREVPTTHWSAGDVTVEATGPNRYRITGAATPRGIAAMTAWCADHDVLVSELRVARRSLEDVFMALTRGGGL